MARTISCNELAVVTILIVLAATNSVVVHDSHQDDNISVNVPELQKQKHHAAVRTIQRINRNGYEDHMREGFGDASSFRSSSNSSSSSSERSSKLKIHHERLYDVIGIEWSNHVRRRHTTDRNWTRRDIEEEVQQALSFQTIDSNMDVIFAQKIHALTMDAIHHTARRRGHHLYDHQKQPTLNTCQEQHQQQSISGRMVTSLRNDRPHSRETKASETAVGKKYLPSTMYGADPTGQKDSTMAFQRVVNDILTSCQKVNKCPSMASGIVDLGGAVIDLEGGSYLISEPIYIPPFYGNLNIGNGVLRANPDHFPNSSSTTSGSSNRRWLIEIGNLTQCLDAENQIHDQQNSCHEFINLHHLLLDANHVAAGGIKASAIMGATIDAVFVTHFPYVGIQIDEGHEVMIANSWLAEWYWKGDHPTRGCYNQNSIGIQINGQDHYVTNTIVFHCTKVGVQIHGGANVLEGVHTWNGGGTGIQILKGSSQNRLIGCYLDYNSLDAYTPIQRLTVEFGFFLQTGVRLIASNATYESSQRMRSTLPLIDRDGKILIDGLILRSNSYSIWNDKQPINVIGQFPSNSIKNVQVMDDFYANKATKVSKSLGQQNSSSWVFDFDDELLFPFIDRVVSYTVVPLTSELSSASPASPKSEAHTFFQHMLLPIRGTTVEVVTSEPIDATVHVIVEQG